MKTLKDYLTEYKEKLCGKTVLLGLSTKEGIQTVSFEFRIEHFCHLMGVEKCFAGINRDTSAYKGFRGASNIENDLLTFKDMERSNRKEYSNSMKKARVFEELLLTIEKYYRITNYVEFDRNKYIRTRNNSFVDNSMMKSFVGRNLSINAGKPIMLLGVDKRGNFYFPLSLLYITDSIVGILDGQNILRLSSIELKSSGDND